MLPCLNKKITDTDAAAAAGQRCRQKGVSMMKAMDFRLAETYVPIGVSLVKGGCIVCMQYTLHVSMEQVEGHRGNVACVLLLLLDRIIMGAREVVVDSNALCWTVLCAHMILIPPDHTPGGEAVLVAGRASVALSALLLCFSTTHLAWPVTRRAAFPPVRPLTPDTWLDWMCELGIPFAVAFALAFVTPRVQDTHGTCMELGIKSMLFVALSCMWVYTHMYCVAMSPKQPQPPKSPLGLTALACGRFCVVLCVPHLGIALAWGWCASAWMTWTCMRSTSFYAQKRQEMPPSPTPSNNSTGLQQQLPSSVEHRKAEAVQEQQDDHIRIFMEAKAKMMTQNNTSTTQSVFAMDGMV